MNIPLALTALGLMALAILCVLMAFEDAHPAVLEDFSDMDEDE